MPRDIKPTVDAIAAAVKADQPNVALDSARVLLVGFLTDVNRIADALERLASPPVNIQNG